MFVCPGGKDVPVKLLVNPAPYEIVPQHLRATPGNADSPGFITFAGNCKGGAIFFKHGIAYSKVADLLGTGPAGIHEGEQHGIPLSIDGRRIREPE